jgi:very-short-patch-repair endonuclease
MAEGNLYKEDDASKLAGELFGGKLTVAEALSKLRTRLLDLTMRNRLLNYRHPKGRSFQFTDDPDLNLLFERLEEGKLVSLVYVPDPPAQRYENGKKPDVRAYAREQGIGTTVDIGPSAATTAYKRLPGLQVLQYPADLERMVRKVSSEARTVIEETGTNMLYLMFGFLEYYDSDDSEKAVHAPLLSMPVNLARGRLDPESRTYIYDVSYSGEDIAENFTLREKLRQQFRLELPPLEEEDDPESYFAKIQAAVSKRRNWGVKRRLSLGFLSFGKLAIWADLDPERAESLLSSELLRDIFEGGRKEASGAFHAEDYVIDSHADGELPLIYDADSSQHSAIIDVKNGKSLVINGPPGTGKSQTITNIVASAIADGKKVLFVSEKLAALEVVKQRLESAGLGDFCLELHSHKTQKKQLLESIEQRMARRYSHPSGYEKRIDVLRERRKGLNTYAELLGSKLGNSLELTVHEVFWTTERRRQALDGEVEGVVGLGLARAADWRAEKVDRCRMTLGDAASALEELGCAPNESAWLGFFPGLLIKGDEVPVQRTVEEALGYAIALEDAAAELQHALSSAPWSIQELQVAKEAGEALSGEAQAVDGQLLERMFVGGIGDLERVTGEVKRLSSMLDHIRQLRAQAAASLVTQDVVDADAFHAAHSAAKSALTDSALDKTCQELGELARRTAFEAAALRDLVGDKVTAIPHGPDALRECLETARDGQSSSHWASTTAKDLLRLATDAQEVAHVVKAALDQIEAVLRASHVRFAGRVEELQALVDGRGFPELLTDSVTDPATLDELRRLSDGGWHDWTAEQFTATARDIRELTANANEASDELRGFFSRLAIPVENTRSGLEAIEVLLSVAQDAPKELLALRGPGLERADFADIAIRAEETHKSLAHKAAKVAAAFHLDTLPEDEMLRAYVRVFRRGDSFFNLLRADWRQAKAAFRGCCKEKKKLGATAMGEQFSAVLSWKTAQAEFVDNEQYRSALGALFEGLKTDFNKVRRLHTWLRSSAPTLLATDLGQHVNLNTLSEQHVSLLVSSATRVRGWVARLQALSKAAVSLPGLDPALAHARRVEELFRPLGEYEKSLGAGAALLRATVRPTATVQRAVELLELRRRLAEHGGLLRSLILAPERLAQAGQGLGMPSSPLSYQHLGQSVADVASKAQAAKKLGEQLSQGLGHEYSTHTALEVLEALRKLNEASASFLSSKSVPTQGSLLGVGTAREQQARGVEALARVLGQYTRPHVSAQDVVSAMQASLGAAELLHTLTKDAELAKYFGTHLQGVDTDEQALHSCLEWAAMVKSVAGKLPPSTPNRLLRHDATDLASAVASALQSANAALASYKASMDALSVWGRLDWSLWGGAPLPSDAVARLRRACDGAASLIPWSKFLAAKEDAVKLGLAEVLARVEQGKLSAGALVRAFEFVFYRTLSRGILADHKELARFTGSGHERLRAEFAELDKELIVLNGAMYASKVDRAKKLLPGVSAGRAGDLIEMALLTKETNKQKRHIPIRQLLKRAGHSLQELKPCFMMGPLSVAQYLEQGFLKFDLVVMDEASQLRPEDALGAIARGSQLVVVGDPKQLPPTNFFDRLMDGDDEDPEDAPSVVDGVESILGICEHLYRPVRTLRWHYRSRHESLIAFSNSQFYDGRLVVFPSPYKRNRRLGVNYRYVREGVYQDRRNIPEAQRVVDAVMEHMLTCPEESLGVVTLNQTQRELIEDLLDKKVRNVAGVSEYLERHEKAGWKFFVKNLENVQGDERDVIFVSTTFGKPPGATAVPQYFGPINRPDGWRRLNVLFTRARRRIDLFTSMAPGDVRVDEKATLGRRAFREYLEYAKTGVLPNPKAASTEREPDSDFEIAVADALRAKGYETQSQVGVAGYFIDLGVRHPERLSEYLAGIECDGVTYHSSLSARDRDRIRQEILESLGWRGRIIRVWSTDWFADPIGQTGRLVSFLEQRRTHDQGQPAPYSDEDHEARADVEHEEVDASSVNVSNEPVGDGAAASVLPPGDTGLFVELGDRVTYEVLVEPTERHTVQIVDSQSNLRLGLLNEETPVAQALLGLCVGDEATLQVKDQPPRPLRVLKIARQAADEAVSVRK